ncbi:MAG: hypothetical protein AXW12_00545 [Thalassospira sp. Nap_22]|nr:MAG: hypothetical protein AXW12_00545 [Thalassospira sp. Nap_22]
MTKAAELRAEINAVRPALAKLRVELRSMDSELANRFITALEQTVDGVDTLLGTIEERNAMLAEMSGALSQLMGSAAEPENKNTAAYFKEGMNRARAVQEMYSRQLGYGQ